MPATLMLALMAEVAVPAAPRPPGIYFGDVALCSLEKPAPTTAFRSAARLPKSPSFELVLSKAALDFGIDDESLLLIERRLGGIIMISVRITATAVPGREGVYEVLPAADLWPDDYSFAISRNSAIVFFGCSFTTLP